MSDYRFIKFIDSPESDFLFTNHPNAFLLLCLIAKRARREKDGPDGLKIGECFIGDHKSCGLTRSQYRTALKILIVRKHVEIVKTCRTRAKKTNFTSPDLDQNLATGMTTEIATEKTTIGTKVKLIYNNVWDINSIKEKLESNNAMTTEIATEIATESPPISHEEECKNVRIRKEEAYKTKTNKKTREDPLVASLLTSFYDSLFSFVPSFNPQAARKTESQYRAMERLLQVHGEVKVREVFAFAHKDNFWILHVHTPVYLAAKFEKLLLQMQRGGVNGQTGTRPGEKPAFTGSSNRKHVDRRTRNVDGTPVANIVEGIF